ncbi:MAG TPA: PEP/pyruvate-binding domain-containing protein [Propionicimonas sp.]
MIISPYVSWFGDASATLAGAGGKGASLGRMYQAGFPVPPGYIVTTNAYRAFVEANGLREELRDLATSYVGTSETRLVAIRQIFARGTMPAAIEEAITQAAFDLILRRGGLPLAVRSSATAEDQLGASFAGQFHSYLNVRGDTALLEAVQLCWSSLWTARALGYCARQGVDPSAIDLAVVVQVMVPAQASGVMFTANPVTGVRGEISIDGAWGLGEAIVGGLVTPDHVVVDMATEEVKQITIADKAVMTTPEAIGTRERAVEEIRRHAQVLESPKAIELARLGAKIEGYFGTPQDIEWCLADDTFSIVQARPITTLPSRSVEWTSPIPGAKWIKDLQAGEWATEPLSPLGATTTFLSMMSARQRKLPMQRRPWHALINGWLYTRADFRLLWLMVAPVGLLWSLVAGRLDGHNRMRRLWPSRLTDLNTLDGVDLHSCSDERLFAHLDRSLANLGWWWWEVTWYSAAALIGEQILRKFKVPGLADVTVLFRGNDSLLLEGERALREATQTGESSAYLARFGHFVESADPIHRTLRESPDLLSQQFAAAGKSPISPDERLERVRRQREEGEKLVHSVPGLRGVLARWVLALSQGYASHTDDAVFHFQRVLALIRAALLEVGLRLANAGVLQQAEDVFYLEYPELRQARATSMSDVVDRRRTLRDSQKHLAPPPFIPPASDQAWRDDPQMRLFSSVVGEPLVRRGLAERDGRKVLVGVPGSPGRVRGTARVITGPEDFHRLKPGDVLVAHATTPVWTPLFNIASAAITEVGGPFSHAAIVAREFGIPLVSGAIDATHLITDGVAITVDGSAGVAEL